MEIAMHKKITCLKCDLQFGNNVYKRHEEKCQGKHKCPVCNKEYIGKSKTCSYSCSNTLFRSGEQNPNWKDTRYRTTCFAYHKKQCVVCGEDKIVSVHHMNEDRTDNSPENLIPLCPTHHQYFHSRYRNEVEHKIVKYLEKWKISL
jgi:hypothetical protein